MKYHTVMASTCEELDDTVNALLEKGWTPIGGIAVATSRCYGLGKGNLFLREKSDKQYSTLIQAMINKGE